MVLRSAGQHNACATIHSSMRVDRNRPPLEYGSRGPCRECPPEAGEDLVERHAVVLPGFDDGKHGKAERLLVKAAQQAGLPVEAIEDVALRKAPSGQDHCIPGSTIDRPTFATCRHGMSVSALSSRFLARWPSVRAATAAWGSLYEARTIYGEEIRPRIDLDRKG